ncbi:uncharacterized protein TRAVEDRAFT_27841 [Trametes versicolor FP-101664 SS1]|uniref:uncharacterized protein n=1 Tax=Trametes versicolor (strain FP-101664) TaxID=717944 RepID=UPI00046226B0|nr:uncharacterized protein TRAVEDRAFT_27841 [Trametes versicolor FP-101664 SS1]EIW60164.1 hypothetical protein TRAVEDRAFT_27841 [Trametes versicolor FP-101664 SS1]
MLSLSALRHSPPHPGCKLKWDAVGANELTIAAQELSSADFIMKPNELHLAFDVGPLRSRNHSRFKRTTTHDRAPPMSKSHLDRARDPWPPALSRSSTTASLATAAMTLTADAAVLVTRHVRRESTHIVWGGMLAFEPPADRVALRAVLVKIAVDEEGAEDLREHARHYEALAERGLYVGYYGLFVDRIGSTALVVEDFGEESPRSESASVLSGRSW